MNIRYWKGKYKVSLIAMGKRGTALVQNMEFKIPNEYPYKAMEIGELFITPIRKCNRIQKKEFSSREK